MLGWEENRKERKEVFVQFCAENIYRNYLYIVISRNQSRNNKECRSIQQAHCQLSKHILAPHFLFVHLNSTKERLLTRVLKLVQVSMQTPSRNSYIQWGMRRQIFKKLVFNIDQEVTLNM